MNHLSLRVCRNNKDRFSLPVELWEGRGGSVECVECLAQCGDCEAGPFVEAGEELIFADSLPDLAARMKHLEPKLPLQVENG